MLMEYYYSISGSEININSLSGVLTFVTAPDYEAKSNSSAVTASDGTYSTDQNITVEINNLNENENAPQITSSASLVLMKIKRIGTVTATDADGDTITASISGSEININSSSGVLTFVTTPLNQI